MAWRANHELQDMFAEVGDNVLISTRAVFYEPEKMRIGSNSRIDDFCLLSGSVTIGQNVHLAVYTHVAGGVGGVVFSDFSGCAYGCHVLSQADDYSGASLTNPTVPKRYKNDTFASVHIGRHALLGTGTIVLPGCDVGEGAATGAGTVVTRSLDSWTIHVGQPAKALRPRSKQILELESLYLQEIRDGVN